ncbi:hypothetical protein Vafri_21269 [Volvox africanus]|uniref:Pherophorin domain-containing protein n=1 Tax=Volvox africanus TaxID=51714 RepID=A0A8J4BUZ3_9CHLO|nr:hypothetical protein Vafri_21269 [Volvox africanus]
MYRLILTSHMMRNRRRGATLFVLAMIGVVLLVDSGSRRLLVAAIRRPCANVSLPTFPYNSCCTTMAEKGSSSFSPYRIEIIQDPFMVEKEDIFNSMCFKIHVSQTVPNCRKYHYCCHEAVVDGLEVDVNPLCYFNRTRPSAFIRVVRGRKYVPATLKRASGSSSSGRGAVVRLNKLGLKEKDVNQTIICIFPGKNKHGLGCTSLTELCTGDPTPVLDSNNVAVMTPSSCLVALSYKHGFCCTSGKTSFRALLPAQTPAYPYRPNRQPNLPILVLPPSEVRCSVCLQMRLVSYSYVFVSYDCEVFIAAVNYRMQNLLLEPISNSTLTCMEDYIQVCGDFIDLVDDPFLLLGIPASLGLIVEDMVQMGTLATCTQGSSIYLAAILNDGYDGTCQTWYYPDTYSHNCLAVNVNFPRCQCSNSANPTPFIVRAIFSRLSVSRSPNTYLYCFDILTLKSATGSCFSNPNSQLLSQVSFYAKEAMRSKLTSIGVLAPGAAFNRMVYYTPSWDAGQATVKVMNLNWNTSQASGSKVCLELDKSISPSSFCEYEDGTPNCWLALHDKNNCPTKPASNGQTYCCPRFQATFM